MLNNLPIKSALIFTRTKHGADRVTKELCEANFQAAAIHGNKSQNARQAALESFKNKTIQILVATDIAARGIDIDELTHVINFEIPNIPETYVHRIGRTGRAGLGGVALSFCDIDEKPFLADIEKLLGKHIHVVKDNPYLMKILTPTVKLKAEQAFEKPNNTSRQSQKPKINQKSSKQKSQFYSKNNPTSKKQKRKYK